MEIISLPNYRWFWFSLVAPIIMSCLAHQALSQVEPNTVAFTFRYYEVSTRLETGQALSMPNQYYAIRSDGSVSQGSLDERYGQRSISNKNKRTQVMIYDYRKLKSTLDFSYIPVSPQKEDTRADCNPNIGQPSRDLTYLGVDNVGDYLTYRYQELVTVPDGGKHEIIYWYSPALNCYPIQTVVHMYDSEGILTNENERKGKISLGEPEDSLFDIPDDYVEVQPSGILKASLLQMVGDREGTAAAEQYAIPSTMQQMLDMQDKRYEDARAKRLPQ